VKKIIFRVVCSEKSGIGHLMRSIWLAKILKKKNKIIFFINNDTLAKKMLRKFRIAFRITTTNFPLKILEAKLIKTFRPNLLICDSPIISDNWFKYFYYQNIKTLEICNSQRNSKFSQYKLWPEVYPKGLNQKKNRFGFNYSLISPAYRFGSKKKTRKKISNILVTFGGCDHLRLTEKIIKFLNSIKKKLFIKIVIGKFYKNAESIKKISKKSIHKILLLNTPSSLYRFYKNTDLVINGGGTTALEVNSLRINSLIFAIWKSQEKLTKKISQGKNYIICHNKSKRYINIEINKMLQKTFNRNTNIKIKKKVDGKGCLRTAEWIKTIIK
tara:strand:+ start:6423 stop:7406 length:984 start_codon:yes stop_codon:yes gene_type:complete